jgi:septum formation protein
MPLQLPPSLILASASPRRRELLWQLGVPHEAQPADVDERRLPGEGIEPCVQRLAHQKAERIFELRSETAGVSRRYRGGAG